MEMKKIKVDCFHEIPGDFTGIAEFSKGRKVWLLNGRIHRSKGPAVEEKDGTKMWIQNGKQHRRGSPAIIKSSGDQFWWQNGLIHRIDGPAAEYIDGDRKYFVFHQELSEKQFEIFLFLLKNSFQKKKTKKLMMIFVKLVTAK